MSTIAEIRERVAEHLEKHIKDDKVVITTEFSPVLETRPDDICIAITPASLQCVFADRGRYSYEPKIDVTITRKIGKDREDCADAVLEYVDKVVGLLLGVGFDGCIVKSLEIAEPILQHIEQHNQAASRITLNLYTMKNRGGG